METINGQATDDHVLTVLGYNIPEDGARHGDALYENILAMNETHEGRTVELRAFLSIIDTIFQGHFPHLPIQETTILLQGIYLTTTSGTFQGTLTCYRDILSIFCIDHRT